MRCQYPSFKWLLHLYYEKNNSAPATLRSICTHTLVQTAVMCTPVIIRFGHTRLYMIGAPRAACCKCLQISTTSHLLRIWQESIMWYRLNGVPCVHKILCRTHIWPVHKELHAVNAFKCLLYITCTSYMAIKVNAAPAKLLSIYICSLVQKTVLYQLHSPSTPAYDWHTKSHMLQMHSKFKCFL